MALRSRDIKVALVRHGKTSRQVAGAVGLSPASFSRLIHGHRRADSQLLELIERAINEPHPAEGHSARATKSPRAI